jgi:hypothetical protein
VLEQSGADLDDDVQAAHIQRRPLPEPDLDITGPLRPGDRILRTSDRLADNTWQDLAKATENLFAHSPVIGHIDQRHATSLPDSAGWLQLIPGHRRPHHLADTLRLHALD